MTNTDPESVLLAEIERLQQSIQPTLDQIKELEASIAETRQQIANTELAVAAVRGQLARPAATGSTTRRARGTRSSIGATTDDLHVALTTAAEPLTAGQIRDALGIPSDVSSITMSRFLSDAVTSGRVTKQGERRGTRYSAV